ncbi:MAG: dihydropyrimidinase [Streptosporangiaceae bacterium]
MRTVISGGTVVTAAQAFRADVLVRGERIAAVGMSLAAGADRVIDATGKYVIPGGVDAHTHLELATVAGVACDDFVTGTQAAACGGTTTIIDYAGHDRGEPPLAGLARWQRKAAGRAQVDYGFHMMISEVTAGVLGALADLAAEGVTSVKLFMAYPGVYMIDDAAIFRALRETGGLGMLAAFHAENGGPIEVLRAEAVAAGRTQPRFHAQTRPALCEGEATSRAIALAEMAGAPAYIAHMSAAEALAAVHAARDRGRPVYAETCPQYLFLDDTLLAGPHGERYACSPPLRTPAASAALWAGLRRGDVDVVATDHCPFTAAQKAGGADDFTAIPNGLHGVEERVTLLYQGVHRGLISLSRWVELAATGPARLFGLAPRKGAIMPGADADIVVFDPAPRHTLSAAGQHSAVDYSVYEGLEVHGQVQTVLLRGEEVAGSGGFRGRPGGGRYLSRGLPQL